MNFLGIQLHILEFDSLFFVMLHLVFSSLAVNHHYYDVLLNTGDEGKSLDVYFPAAVWYDWYTLDVVTNQGQLTLTIDTPLDHIPVNAD